MKKNNVLLANRKFMLFWSGSFISFIGDAMYEVAIMWIVYQQTDSAVLTSGILVMEFSLQVILGSIGGVIADYFPRWKVAFYSQLACAIVLGSSYLFISLGFLNVFVIYFTDGMLTLMRLLIIPATQSAIPQIVPKKNLAKANGYFSFSQYASLATGYAVGGFLLGFFGASALFVINAISFIVAGILILLALKGISRVVASEEFKIHNPFMKVYLSLKSGWKYFFQSRVLVSILIFATIANLGGGLITGLVPVLAEEVFHTDAEGFSYLQMASVLGAVIGSIFISFSERFKLKKVLMLSMLIGGIVQLSVFFTDTFSIALILFAVMGMTTIFNKTTLNIILQVSSSDEIRGRIIATFRTLIGLTPPMSVFLGGLMAEGWGVPIVFLISGLIVMASVVPLLKEGSLDVRSVDLESH